MYTMWNPGVCTWVCACVSEWVSACVHACICARVSSVLTSADVRQYNGDDNDNAKKDNS